MALEQDAPDLWAWFNAGTSAVTLGQVEDAALYYDEAFRLGLPFRMLWYQFGPYEAYYRTGRYYDVIRLAKETEAITTEIEETVYWRGLAYAALGRADESLADLNTALTRNPNFDPARQALAQIEAGTYLAPAPLRTIRPDLP